MSTICLRCKGLLIEHTYYDHGLWHKDMRCLNCGRYYPIHAAVNTVTVTPDMKLKQWRRVTQDVIDKAKTLLDAGKCIAVAAKNTGIGRSTLAKIVKRNGWQVISVRPNRKKGGGIYDRL